jgi:KipI family sensor histidine kinase inhibitor
VTPGAGPQPALRRYGDRAWLISDPDPVALAARLRGARWPQPVEVVVGACTCLLVFDGPAPAGESVAAELARTSPAPAGVHRRRHRIPVRYRGPDLADVAAAAGLAPQEVVALHSGATYRVSFLGFAPGFAYLEGLPEPLRLPRRPVPRVRVPAGSLAVAADYCAIYPGPSPGGWHLLGWTGVQLFDPAASPPSLFQAGDEVVFEPAHDEGPGPERA